jgi:RNA polymerase sigma-70 factor (ECF subfamily)
MNALNNGMLRVFKNIDQWNPSKGSFENWLYAIVRNSALSEIRNAKKSEAVEYHENLNKFESEDHSTTHMETDMQQYMQALPETSRIVCNLFYFHNYSIKDVARELDIKEGTVKWHLHSAREQIRGFLNNKKR